MTAPRWQSNLLYDFRRNIYSWTLKLPHSWGKASTDTQQTLVIRMQHGKTSGPFLLLRFSHSVMSNFLRTHGQQHIRLPCPSTSAGACSNSCSLSRWCHPTILSSIIPFSSCLQSFPASASFLMSQFASGGQSIGVSTSASVLPMNSQDWFPLGWTGWISLQSKGLSRVFFNTTSLVSNYF